MVVLFNLFKYYVSVQYLYLLTLSCHFMKLLEEMQITTPPTPPTHHHHPHLAQIFLVTEKREDMFFSEP